MSLNKYPTQNLSGDQQRFLCPIKRFNSGLYLGQWKTDCLHLWLVLAKREEELCFRVPASSRGEILQAAHSLCFLCAGGSPAGHNLAFQEAIRMRSLDASLFMLRARLTSVPSTLPGPILECESSDCYLRYRIPFFVCSPLPAPSVSLNVLSWDALICSHRNAIIRNQPLSPISALSSFCPLVNFTLYWESQQLILIIIKYVCIFRWLFPLGTPWWEQGTRQNEGVYEPEIESQKRPGRLKAFLDS